MYVVFTERRCKDKNYLANNVQSEPFFFAKVLLFRYFSRFDTYNLSFSVILFESSCVFDTILKNDKRLSFAFTS